MAVSVDPFSFAVAELSEEYVSVFPRPDIVPKYLEKVSDKTGVQLLTGINSISVKGSWVSLKRVRSFLTEFLVSYQKVNQDENKEDIERFDQSNPVSDDVEDSTEYEDSFQVPDDESSFTDNVSEQSDWLKWTAEVLPQIQPVRSKRTRIFSEMNSQSHKVPEPLVCLANYQPAPDPAAKNPPTLDAIEKVLKTVYEKDKVKREETPHTEKNACSSDLEDAASTGHEKRELDEDVGSADSFHDISVCSNDEKDKEHDILKDCSDQHDGSEVQHMTEVTSDTSTVELGALPISVSFMPNVQVNLKATLALPVCQESHDITNDSGSDNVALTNGKSRRLSNRKRKAQKKEKESDASEVVTNMKAASVVEQESQKTMPETKEKNVVPTVTDQNMPTMRKAKRKGNPKKNEKYVKKKPDSDAEEQMLVTVTKSSRAERVAKRSSVPLVRPKSSQSGLRGESRTKKRARSPKPTSETVHVKEEDTDFVCDQCSYVAKKLSHLREHKRRVHITKEFKCDKCGKIFGFGKDLKRHFLTHQKAENCCDICGKMYKTVRTLADHKKTHDTDYVKPEFPCEFCDKIFSTKYVLAYHIKSEHLGIKKSYMCPTCGKSFSQKNSYLQHANVHMGIKPYHCDICGKSFSYEKSLKEHKYMHADDKQFECPVCNKKFRQSSGVAIHMKIHKDRKDYVCSACGKGFSQKQALVRHERIHLGEKPFACSLCKRTFTDSSILRRHMMLIHKKDKTNWREHTENNVQRRTDFFISVVAEDGKPKKREQPVEDIKKVTNDEQSSIIQESSAATGKRMAKSDLEASESDSVQNADGTCSFTGTGVSSSVVASILASVPSSVVPAAPSVSVSQGGQVFHLASDSCTMATPPHNINSLHAVNRVEQEQREDNLTVTFPSTDSRGPSGSSQPVDMSSQSQASVQLQEHSSTFLSSFTLSDAHHPSHADTYSSVFQQDGVSVTGVPVTQYSSAVTHENPRFRSEVILAADAMNASQQYHSGSDKAGSMPPATVTDYGNLVSQSSMQKDQ